MMFRRNLAKGWSGEFLELTVGLRGTSGLYIFGNPKTCGSLQKCGLLPEVKTSGIWSLSKVTPMVFVNRLPSESTFERLGLGFHFLVETFCNESAGFATEPAAQIPAKAQVYPGHSKAKEPVADQPLPQADVLPASQRTNTELTSQEVSKTCK
ncbi:hypothetical protein NQ315_003610 [Exocentrus adspersus]|uniref:Uncharacterized protein n=1 Tax=Exocentrus adspersus TaxID=1586481 RepID=A0AAV8VJE6_9CUCU|nr:hypothetical protein NQ315_003610 [Exocentrus adspersus]